MAGQPLQPGMTQEQVQALKEKEKEEWRQFLLEQLINFLEQNRDSILSDYESINTGQLSREAIEAHGLLVSTYPSPSTRTKSKVLAWAQVSSRPI